jgi:hypothetical protein
VEELKVNRRALIGRLLLPLLTACSLSRAASAPQEIRTSAVSTPSSPDLQGSSEFHSTSDPMDGWVDAGVNVSGQDWAGKPQADLPAFLFQQYLEKFMGAENDAAHRLEDCQILMVDDLGYLPEFILADVRYSVKPAESVYSAWNAGNGESRAGDAWIRNKTEKIAVFRGSEWHVLELIGTA